ncbi:MAG: endo-1,4-beta-xylanase [Anaerolineae bacterium]
MFLRGFVMLCLALLLAFTSLAPTTAQSTPATPTLREMADKNKFYVGAAVYTYHLSDPLHVETVKTQFNMMTPENEAKACELQKARGVFNFTKMDQLMDFAEQNNMVFRGHTLVWHSCTPNWFSNGKFSRDEAIQILRDHIMTVVGRYKGRIPIWDVVNEGIADGNGKMRVTPWQQMIGDDYIELAFRFAHEADPEALLFYNDYGAEGMNAKSDAIYNMVKDFKARGVPIDGVGLQAHLTLGDTRNGRGASPRIMGENIKRLGELGVQVQLTEVDIKHKGEPTEDILRQEAAEYRSVLQTCLDSGYCTAFIVWGVTDKYSWLRDSRFYDNPKVAPLLFDDHYQPKPAFTAILYLLARRPGEPPILSDDEVAI